MSSILTRKFPANISRRAVLLNRGATMVEGAITSVVFFALVLFVIDIGRYFFTLLVLNYAVSTGVDLASKLDIETVTDSTAASCENYAYPDPKSCQKYLARLNTIVTLVTKHANLVSGEPSSTSSVRRVNFAHYSDVSIYPHSLNCNGCLSIMRSVAFVRPGERVIGGGRTYQIPGRPFCDPPATACGPPSATESWAELFTAHPFAIHLDAEFSPVTPLLPVIRIAVRQYGYRRVRTTANSGTLPTIIPTPVDTFTPTPVSTWDPASPPWTATPTGTATAPPTPTNTLPPGVTPGWGGGT